MSTKVTPKAPMDSFVLQTNFLINQSFSNNFFCFCPSNFWVSKKSNNYGLKHRLWMSISYLFFCVFYKKIRHKTITQCTIILFMDFSITGHGSSFFLGHTYLGLDLKLLILIRNHGFLKMSMNLLYSVFQRWSNSLQMDFSCPL